jgi:hypothetical protein
VIRFRPRFGASSAFFLFAFFLVSLARAVFAASNDAEAGKLRQAAIEQDYLATDFAAAEAKLTQALALCKEPGSCALTLRARIHCDFGVVYFAEQKKDEADAQFVAAVKDDPNVTIGPDLSTPEVQKELAGAKASAPPAAGAAATADTGEATPPPPTGKSSASSETTDCPPGFPGCKTVTPATTCSTNDDCNGGETCQSGTCSGATESSNNQEDVKPKDNWLSLAFEQDLLLLPSANNVCAGGSGYTCFQSNGTYDKLVPDPKNNGNADSVTGGLALANQIIMAGYDRSLGSNFTVGARIGFAISSAPTRPGGTGYFPLHLEARATYWIGHNALSRKGFRPFVLLAGGGQEVASSLSSFVYDTGSTQASQYQAWKRTGQGFVALGVGTAIAFSPNFGVVVEVRGMQLFPTSGTALGLQLGFPLFGF